MIYVFAVLLTLANIVFWLSILFNLPGAWLMLLTAVVVEWLNPGVYLFGTPVLLWAAGLALLGELLEFALGAVGAQTAGGSKRAAGLAIVGGILGAIAGTFVPVPILGTLVGASIGAFAGSLVGDVWAGRALRPSLKSGRGAALGRFWGTVAKLATGGLVAVLLSVAAFV